MPAKLLADIVAALPDGEVTIQHLPGSLRLTCGAFESTITGLDAEDFPSLPCIEDGLSATLPGKNFARAIHGTAFCAASDDTRPVLQGVLVSIKDSTVTVSAADGYQLARCTFFLDEATPQTVQEIIPAGALRAIAPLFADHEQLTLTITATAAIFAADGITAISRLIDGKYPDVERIIPITSLTHASLNRAELESALKMAALFATQSNNVVRFTFKEASLTLAANAAEVGNQEAIIDASVSGVSPFTIAANVKFAKQIVFRPVASDDVLYILMPMTVQ